MAYGCRIEADSVSPAGKRITTFVVTYPRFVHAELMTHRVFSRNSSSSRAIPVEKMIEQVERDPAMPVWWGKNQKGMQAHEQLSDVPVATGDGPEMLSALAAAKRKWLVARDEAVYWAKELLALGLHKQVANRLLEPWMWITVVVTATEWDGWFRLRAPASGPMDPAFPAQPELQQIAVMMRDEYAASRPQECLVHLPFAQLKDQAELDNIADLPKICVGRCARVSYLTHDGRRDPAADVELFERLQVAGHWSPFEHVAYASLDARRRSGNFFGWRQLREELDPHFIR